MGNIIPYSSLRAKQLPYPGHFQKLEILGVETHVKHAGRVNPQSPHMHLERANWSFFASPLLPTKREEGVMLWTPASDIWQCQLPPAHPVPTFSTLAIDACSSKLSDHKRIAPTHCGSILGLWEHGRAMDLSFLLRKVGWLSLRAGSLLGLQWARGCHMVDAGRSGASWAGVAVCIPWHDGLYLLSCSTCLPLICISASSSLWAAFLSQYRTPHQGR